eukprot:2476008-Rhodomonas_salina.2
MLPAGTDAGYPATARGGVCGTDVRCGDIAGASKQKRNRADQDRADRGDALRQIKCVAVQFVPGKQARAIDFATKCIRRLRGCGALCAVFAAASSPFAAPHSPHTPRSQRPETTLAPQTR